MDQHQPHDILEFEVIFSRSRSGHIVGQELPLDGKGRVQISGKTVTFCGQSDRASASSANETLAFTMEQVANVGIRGKQISFCIYPPGDGQEGVPLYIGSVWVRNREDAERLFKMLPRRLTTEVRQMAAERNAFAASIMKATSKVFVTRGILSVNVLIFIGMLVSGVAIMDPTIEDLLRWGADYGPMTLTGEWWRLLTNTFVHIGLIHLAMNMWVLNHIGGLVERLYGNGLFLLIYLAAGITGSLASVWINPETVSAGASGAIFGLYGALAGFSWRQHQAIPKSVLKELQSSSFAFVAYNVVFGFSVAGIDNAAHIGGLIGGVILGYVAAMPLDIEYRRRVMAKRFAQTCGVFVIIALILFTLTPRATYGKFVVFMDFYEQEEEFAYNAQTEIGELLDNDQITPRAAADRMEVECLRRWRTIERESQDVSLSSSKRIGAVIKDMVTFAGLRADSLEKIIAGMRTDNEDLFNEGMRLQSKAEEFVGEYRE